MILVVCSLPPNKFATKSRVEAGQVLTRLSSVPVRIQSGGCILCKSRGTSLQHALDLTNIYLDEASKTQHPDIAFVLCHNAEIAISQAKKAAKHIEDQTARQGIAIAYIELGKELDDRGYGSEAQASYKKAEKWVGAHEGYIAGEETTCRRCETMRNGGTQASVKEWIVIILMRLSSSTEGRSTMQVGLQLRFSLMVRGYTGLATRTDPIVQRRCPYHRHQSYAA
ncbi:MAG: hypothetical protein J3Q66DRAFT_427008 [Benniella sp.]|nr:MAG: hypothetical protein J3Q66DRAFT_427008 [Benniella sp.]